MGLYKRGQVWWMSIAHNGRQIRRSCETASKKLAEEILCKEKTQVVEGKFFEVEAKETTFEELSQEVILDYQVNGKKSLDRIGRNFKHLEKTFKGMRVAEITTTLIQSHIVKRQKEGAKNATINREMAGLKRRVGR